MFFRGSANEWYEALTCNLRASKNVRLWFAQNVLFAQPGRFAEYLLECPSSEVNLDIPDVFCGGGWGGGGGVGMGFHQLYY